MSFDDETTGSADLTQWNEQFGDAEAFPEKTGGSAGFDWELGVAYSVHVKQAKVTKSKYGALQLELNTEVKGDDSDEAPVIGNTRLWFDLPKQQSDIGKDKELVVKLTQRRYSDLLRILSAAAPATYALYNEVKMTNGKKTYVDFDGADMTGSDLNKRKAETQAACVTFAEELREKEGEEVESLADTHLYVVKVENKKNEKYPYTNLYATRPDKVPMFKSVGADAPF